MTKRENILKAVRFERPDYIPMTFGINAACWHHYDQNTLQDLMEAHPFLFPHFQRREIIKPHYNVTQRKDEPYTDPWRCVWETSDNGITGSVHDHPLADWQAFDNYTAPSPEQTDGTHPVNWEQIREHVKQLKDEGQLVTGGLPHGHTFLRLQDIRGYENLIYDMADQDTRLDRLIGMISDFNYDYVMKWIELQPDIMTYPEDLGMQVGPMISPDHFRRYIKPVYERVMKPARERGIIVHMHSDGDIRDLTDELIDGGVEIINLQDLVNGIDWIAKQFRGRICVDLDIDRQDITARRTPEQIDKLIRQEVETVGTPKGGLMMIYGLYPGIPIENIEALMDTMERYTTYYSG